MKRFWGLLATSIGMVCLLVQAVYVQTNESNLPRLEDGRPNLNGIWQALNSANYDIERHLARPAMELREGPHGPLPSVALLALGAVGAVPAGMGVVDGGTIPYTPEALSRKQENRAHWLERDPEIRCYLPGVPRATYMPFPLQIFHNPNAIFIAYEYAGATRDISLEALEPAQTDSWMGQSSAHWEGDTLVVDVTGQNDQTWFDRSGAHHSNQLHVVERYTLLDADHIQYEATIEDSVVFTRPWTIRMPLYRRIENDAQLMDFKCVEFVEELLYGEFRRDPLER